jgi:hypothetical protein
MSRVRFRQSVIKHMGLIEEKGYRLEEKAANSDTVQYSKLLIPGIRCEIEFQPLSHYIPPVRRFKVNLARLRLPDFDKDSSYYAPLAISLMNLLRRYYNLDIFPQDKIAWTFTDKQDLSEELTTVQTLLLEYGIDWLEDPASNVEWVKRPVDRT